jgi:tetratricopeptide (TPR) repeat protein
MTDDTRSAAQQRHRTWDQNPSEQWAFALDHMDAGEWDLAILHCRRAIETWPTYYDAWLLLAGAYEEKAEYDQALEAIRRASEIAIDELSQAWNNLASLHLVRGEWEEAVTIDRVLDLVDPTRHAIIRYRMGVCYTQMGDPETGLKWLREAIDYRPDLLDRALGEPLLAVLHERLQRLEQKDV